VCTRLQLDIEYRLDKYWKVSLNNWKLHSDVDADI